MLEFFSKDLTTVTHTYTRPNASIKYYMSLDPTMRIFIRYNLEEDGLKAIHL